MEMNFVVLETNFGSLFLLYIVMEGKMDRGSKFLFFIGIAIKKKVFEVLRQTKVGLMRNFLSFQNMSTSGSSDHFKGH